MLLLLSASSAVAGTIPGNSVVSGLGRYYTAPRSSADPAPPVAAYRTGAAAGQAAPTNQWYSSVMFERWSQPIHAHPLTYQATAAGFELGLPDKQVLTVNGSREVQYTHVAAIVVAPLAFTPQDARLSNYSDWLAEISMAANNGDALTASILHGSPFSYFECTTGDVSFRLRTEPRMLSAPDAADQDGRVAAFTVDGHSYAVFAPTGSSWSRPEPTSLVLHLPADARYFAVAALPDNQAETLRDFLAHAYAFPVSTRVDWSYDEQASKVRSVFHIETVTKEGTNLTTFMGLYPHQWNSVSTDHASRYSFDSVRGRIRLIAANSFTLEHSYHGFVPWWGGLEDPADKARVAGLLGSDVAAANQLFNRMGQDTYAIGKGLGAVAQLMGVAASEAQLAQRDALLTLLKAQLQTWFDGQHSSYFVQNSDLGTFIGLPEAYGSVTAMNDHHFHYGYWLMGAAYVALLDPAWAAPQNWGGMVNQIIKDIATDERGRKDFPLLRNFDAYEGHSWASGTAIPFAAGNNQESSSEAVNAWAGLILWGEATGNQQLRDLGVWLYTTEIASIRQYWFDLDQQVFAAEYGKPLAAQVFGGKYSYNTWWTQEPRQITGINLLPISGFSTYLGRSPEYVKRNMAALKDEMALYAKVGTLPPNPPPKDIWQDIFAMYTALADPAAGLAAWDRNGSYELGQTRTHTLHWMLSLQAHGTPDFSVHADTPLYQVFKRPDGSRTYLAYNATTAPLNVRFSDGKTLTVAPKTLAQTR